MEIKELSILGLGMVCGSTITYGMSSIIPIAPAFLAGAGVGAILIVGAVAIKHREEKE